jgi:hypothetical protein
LFTSIAFTLSAYERRTPNVKCGTFRFLACR